MKMTTAEIKKLIMECAQDDSIHTPKEFSDYIVRKSGKEFTKGQLAGAVAQLAATGELLSVERGRYRKGRKRTGEIELFREETQESSAFVKEVQDCLAETVAKLGDIVERTNVMNMNQAEFRLLGEIKQLKEDLEVIAVRY